MAASHPGNSGLRTALASAVTALSSRIAAVLARGGQPPLPRLRSRTDPLSLPLSPDEQTGWKPYHQYQGASANCAFLSCHVSVLVPGHFPHQPHSHREEEILLVLEGEALLLLPELAGGETGGRLRLAPGQFAYYPSGCPHTLEAGGGSPVTYLMFKWRCATANQRPGLGFGVFDLRRAAPREHDPQGYRAAVVLDGPTGCLGKLHAHVTTLAPGAGYPPHADRHDVAIVLLEGVIETLGRRLEPHALVFYAAGEPHGIHNPGTAAARYAVFEFHGRPGPFLRGVADPLRRLIFGAR